MLPATDSLRRLDRIVEQIGRLEGVISDSPPEVCPTGIAPIDAALPAGGLIRGGVHEW